IDLILDWTILTGEDPQAERSKGKQLKLNQEIDERGQSYIGGELLQKLTESVAPVCSCEVDSEDHHVLNIRYPGSFGDEYLRPEVRLEIGPLASWLPFAEYTIRPYAAEEFQNIFDRSECKVKAIKAERTFWEKATILHHEANRPVVNIQSPRYSRHYYDLAKMAESPVKETALTDLDLLASVVEFKERFYPRGWARYDLAKPGTLRLVPTGHVLATVTADYRAMRTMIFGDYPPIKTIMTQLQALEDEINGLTA
ncbi:MAG: nucleotidyl transferase AbiEii/AbiGii toxin family protein, partial [Pseudomonadota bacterium]